MTANKTNKVNADSERLELQVYGKQTGRYDRRKKGSDERRNISSSAWYYLGFIGEIGFTISIPIAGGAFLGSFLDRQWSTYPKATLVLLFLGILVSMVGFIKAIQEIIKKTT